MRTRAEVDHYNFCLFGSMIDQIPDGDANHPVTCSDDRKAAALISGLQYGQVDLMVTTENEPLDRTTPPDFDVTVTMHIDTKLVANQIIASWSEIVFTPPAPGPYDLRFRIWGWAANRAHPLEPVEEFWRIDITPH